jgi:putative SOS response-associated peptidase YedK
MCGRFACSEIPKPLADAFGLTAPDDLPARYNIAPSMPVAALIRDDETGKPAFGWLQWGLVPFWAKEKSIGSRMFNARAETAHEKPSFRAAFRHRRCLIPADGFYEWKKEGKRKIPHFITLTDAPMVFAGLWETWTGPGEEILQSCTILTTDANDRVRPIHDRMPVILRPEGWELWMDHRVQSRRELEHLLGPCDSDRLHIEETDL